MEKHEVNFSSSTIEKLIDIISRGCGRVTKAYFDRREADARAYELKAIASQMSALPEGSQQLKIEYKSKAVVVTKGAVEEIQQGAGYIDFQQRALERQELQTLTRQNNLEQITSRTAEDLATDPHAADDQEFEQEWIDRFFSYAESISSDYMQTLWARILSTEIRERKSFSLGALDILRNITREDAERFSQLARFRISLPNSKLSWLPGSTDDITKYLDLRFSHLQTLEELGLIVLKELGFGFPADHDQLLIFFHGDKAITVDQGTRPRALNIAMIKFTRYGSELCRLVKHEYNDKVIEALRKNIENSGWKLAIKKCQRQGGKLVLLDE